MKLTCSQEALSSALSVVSRSVTRTPLEEQTIPEGLQLEADVRGFTVTKVTDRMGASAQVEVEAREQGNVLVNEKIADVVRHFPKGQLTLETRDNQLVITSEDGSSRASLLMEEGADYPLLPVERAACPIVVRQNIFRQMVSYTAYAASQDMTRPILTGVYLQAKQGLLTMVALDGFRMALRSTPIGEETLELSAVIPAANLVSLSRIMEDSEEKVELTINEQYLIADIGNTRFFTRRLKGQYINYEQILPKEWQTAVEVDRSDLLAAVERTNVVAETANKSLVRVGIRENGPLQLHSESVIGKADENIQAVQQGKPLDIAFSGRYCIELLKNMPEDRLRLCFNSAVSPMLIKPLSGNDFLYLLLPVRVSV